MGTYKRNLELYGPDYCKKLYRHSLELYPDLSKINYKRSLELYPELHKIRYLRNLELHPDFNKIAYQRQITLHGREKLNKRSHNWVKRNPERRKIVQKNYKLRKKIFNTLKGVNIHGKKKKKICGVG